MAQRRGLGFAAFAAALGAFVLGTLPREPYDDAHFFTRFSLNLLEHGSLAWNVTDGPVYGNTSQLFQLASVFLTAMGGAHVMLVVRLFSVLCLCVTFALLWQSTAESDGGGALAFAFTSPVALYAVVSGMETALVFVVVAGALSAILSRSRFVPAALFLVWLARPDALVLLVPVLVAEHRARGPQLPLRELGVTLALVTTSLVAFKAYYGTALPLPFYAKMRAFSPYDASVMRASDVIRGVRFGTFALVAAPLGAVAARRRDPLQLGLLAGAALFTAYHFFFTVELMGMQGRFYAPALPLLVVAAARAAATESRRTTAWITAAAYVVGAALLLALVVVPRARGIALDQVPLPHLVFTVLAGTALIALPPKPSFAALLSAASAFAIVVAHGVHPALPSDDDYLTSQTSHVGSYRGLDALRRCFGDALHVYHSEIGLPGLRFRHGTVNDLVGLMDPAWLFREKTIDQVCAASPPDAIFLPHRAYQSLNAEVKRSHCLRNYDLVVERSSSPLYVRKDLVPRYATCTAPWPPPVVSPGSGAAGAGPEFAQKAEVPEVQREKSIFSFPRRRCAAALHSPSPRD